MKKTSLHILSLVIFFFITVSCTNYKQEPSAEEILKSILQNHKIIQESEQNFVIKSTGIYQDDDHPKTREKFNRYKYNSDLVVSNEVEHYSLSQTFIDELDSSEYQFKYIYKNNKEYTYDRRSKKGYFQTHSANNLGKIIRFYATSPYTLSNYILNNIDSIKISVVKKEESFFLNCEFENEEKWVLECSVEDYLCKSFTYKYFDFLLGDTQEAFYWSAYQKSPNGLFPSKLVVKNKGFETLNSQSIVELTQNKPLVIDSLLGESKEDIFNDRIISPDSVTFNQVGNGLYEILLPETNNRLMVVEFKDFLILLEGSYHSKNGDFILAFLKEKFPQKPVKYASFGHCHTQYIGFARSFAVNGTSIITSEDNKAFINQLCLNSFASRPDKLELLENKPKPIFEEFNGEKWSFKDDFNEIEMYNITSDHTNNYMVFYFPKQKSMFVGDLLWVRGSKPLSGRSLTFYNEVNTRLNLAIDTYYISWPLQKYGAKTIVKKEEIILPQSK